MTDLLDGAFYVTDPYSAYRRMRDEGPLHWDATNELWGVPRYDDIVDVERRKDVFINSDQAKGGYRPNIPADPAIIGLDDPLHHQRRNLVSRRFTPRAVSAREDHVRAEVRELIDAVAASGGTAEIVDELAAPLPAKTIAWLLGFPEDRWRDLKEWSERTIVLGGGPRYFNEDGMAAAMEFAQAASELHAEKARCPADDIMTIWTQAAVDGEPLGVDTVISDCLLLLDGGAETTRTVIARTILDLIAHPDQWRALKAGADLTVATEEFIRWVTPIHNMCRVAAVDTEVGGLPVQAGQQLVLMYGSANRDPAHFADPERYDVTRTPNNHIAFGFGTHFCLGAALARMEIRLFFAELVRRVRSMRLVPDTEPIEMPNAFVYGLRSAHVEFDFEPG
ncbi:MAG TPA: cytochrome P450 [Acidimicrobiales bacterium]|jgi:cholest-4-en-3-one 26-monooxygenase|nr:cytochrome P450 [Acidimicrobiales bacterium]